MGERGDDSVGREGVQGWCEVLLEEAISFSLQAKTWNYFASLQIAKPAWTSHTLLTSTNI